MAELIPILVSNFSVSPCLRGRFWLFCPNLEHIIGEVAFRNTAVVDHDLDRWAWQFDSRCRCSFGAHLNPFRDLAAFKQYRERYLRSRIAKVFEGHGNKLHSFF